MDKTIKLVLSGILAVFIGYFIHYMYCVFIPSHSGSWKKPAEYLWIFKDSVKNDISKIYYSSYTKSDIYNDFYYKNNYSIIVWEFKDLKNLELDEVKAPENIELNNIAFKYYEKFDKRASRSVYLKIKIELKEKISFNLDQESKLYCCFEGKNYKGFVADINQMSLSNEYYEPQVVFNYTKWRKQPTIVFVYKGHGSFFLIIINSSKPFDESIINIFNLED